ncbi:MAG: outer membrane beta-barrel protein [Tannerella sp.]|jgi:hypothetical protein|nr:outer membrane beta-barrel protein [Tannerella sp.]
MKLRISITAIVCLMAVNTVVAQMGLTDDKVVKRYQQHEFSIALAAGMSGINSKLESGVHRSQFGGNLGFEYSCNFNDRLALTTGVGFSLYSGNISIDSLSGEYTPVGAFYNEDELFVLKYYLDGGYREKYNAILLNIPLMLKHSIPLGKNDAKYFIAWGLKIGIPVTATSSITPGMYTTKAHYDYENCTYSDLIELGLRSNYVDNSVHSSNIRLAIAPMFAFETGVRIPVGYRRGISVGMYFDYSLSNVQKSNSMSSIEYQLINPGILIHNSVMNTAAVKKMSLLSVGLKVGINLNRGL